MSVDRRAAVAPDLEGCRSFSVRFSTRTMRGVNVRMMSVSAFPCGCSEHRADDRNVAEPRNTGERRSLFVANQAPEHVRFAVFQANHGVDCAAPERRKAPKSRPGNAAQLDLQRKRDRIVMMRARRDVDIHADGLVVERRDRLRLNTAGGDRRKGRDRHGNTLAEPRLGRHAFGRPQLWIGQYARRAIALQQPVIERRKVGEQHVGLVRLERSCSERGLLMSA